MDRNEIRARELLAAEYDPEGGFATAIICDMTIPQRGVVDTVIALRAVSAALRESEGLRRDAERWRMFLRCLHNGHIPGAGHGHRIRLVEECPLFGDESEVSNVESLIDAARKEGV